MGACGCPACCPAEDVPRDFCLDEACDASLAVLACPPEFDVRKANGGYIVEDMETEEEFVFNTVFGVCEFLIGAYA